MIGQSFIHSFQFQGRRRKPQDRHGVTLASAGDKRVAQSPADRRHHHHHHHCEFQTDDSTGGDELATHSDGADRPAQQPLNIDRTATTSSNSDRQRRVGGGPGERPAAVVNQRAFDRRCERHLTATGLSDCSPPPLGHGSVTAVCGAVQGGRAGPSRRRARPPPASHSAHGHCIGTNAFISPLPIGPSPPPASFRSSVLTRAPVPLPAASQPRAPSLPTTPAGRFNRPTWRPSASRRCQPCMISMHWRHI